MFVIHIALQGCLRGRAVEYGVTADTGGHIRYLLDLVRASAACSAFERIEIVTRAFRDARHGECYAEPYEQLDERCRIVRLRSRSDAYLPKEALWAELDSLADALVAHIEGLDRRPDVMHAHYADAGALAARVSARLGIPYVFTGHSLGRVKRLACPQAENAAPALDRRIAIEEEAIAGARAVIASSRDEAEVQYALYDGYDPGRIRVIAPGSDLAAFGDSAVDPAVVRSVDRFLADPAKPIVLAIARPVSRKNIAGLIDAFGRSAALRAMANLVILAGTRDDLRLLEPEIRDNLADILATIDAHDLYGQVAYPKHHRPEDVPAYYALARARRGVFVNPALNEPFGLTLLEAAASGLPIVATDSGGPTDIVEACRNGVLVDPRSADAIADAIIGIIADPIAWQGYAARGRDAARLFDWSRHAAVYADLLKGVIEPQGAAAPPGSLLVCDIDGTLLGCPESLTAFRSWQTDERDLAFAVATGRSFHSAMAVLAQHDAPLPDIVIASVGSEIHIRDGAVYRSDASWEALVEVGWDREAVAALVNARGGLARQSPLEQRRFKLSYLTGGDRGAGVRVRRLLDAAGLQCSIIQSHDRYLDILPHAASKGTAVEHVRRRLGLARHAVIVAGDSGNDVEMLRSSPNAIIVGNHSDGLGERSDLVHGYVASASYARGVLEGVAHFRREASATAIE